MNWKQCVEEGLIRKDSRAPERVQVSIESALRFIQSARKNLVIEEYEMTMIASYNSSFHSARALLFSRGYKERSHACVVIALQHLYAGDQEVAQCLNILNKMRISRHNVQYDAARITEAEALFACEFAEKFSVLVRKRNST